MSSNTETLYCEIGKYRKVAAGPKDCADFNIQIEIMICYLLSQVNLFRIITIKFSIRIVDLIGYKKYTSKFS